MKQLVTDIAERLNPCRFSIIGNDLYLTDCKIAFRIPGAAGFKPECVTAEVDEEAMSRVFVGAKEAGESINIGSIELVDAAPLPCKDCEGTGKVFFCTFCDGDGDVYCEECDNWNGCKHCRGTGNDKSGDKSGSNFETCSCCGGMGAKMEPASLFGYKFDARLLRIISEVAPGATLFAPIGKHYAAYFKAEKVDGLIQRLTDA